MFKLYLNKKQIPFSSVTWSGTDQQSSRELSFTLASNPYDKNFENIKVKLGDMVSFYEGKTRLFLGTVTSRERSGEIGTATYTSKDYMHHLLKSNGSYKFKSTTPEKIAQKVCDDVQIPVGTLAVSNASIPKLFFDNASLYDIIIRAYREAKAVTNKNYMLSMDGNKVCVIEKGQSSGVKLTQGENITGASYTDTLDNMIDVIKIFDDKSNYLGDVRNEKNISKYGIYQQIYKKEKGVNPKQKAESLLVGITRDISVDALGDTKAIAGKSLTIADKATTLSGIFYITSDSHKFENGNHTMTLGLSLQNIMEEGASTK